jgi:hypothetical protein
MMEFVKDYWKSSLLGALGALVLLYIGLFIYDGLTPSATQEVVDTDTHNAAKPPPSGARLAARIYPSNQTRAYQDKYPPKPCTEEHWTYPPHYMCHSCTTTPNRCQDAPYTATAENGCCRNILRDTRW